MPGQRRWLNGSSPSAPQLAQAGVRAATAAVGRLDWPRTLIRKGPRRLERAHLLHQHRPVDAAPLHLIALDNSGSMRRGGRLAWAKAYAARLIDEAARAGDQVALMLFGGQGVQWLQSPTPARRSAIAQVRPLGGGGGTPVAAGLQSVQRALQAHRRRHRASPSTLWLLTDGRSLEQPEPPAAADRIVIVDFDDPSLPLGRCAAWAGRWGAELRQPAPARSDSLRPQTHTDLFA